MIIEVSIALASLLFLLYYFLAKKEGSKRNKTIPVPRNSYPLLGNMLDMLDTSKLTHRLEQWCYEIPGPIYKVSMAGTDFYVISDYDTICQVFKARPHDYYRGPLIENVFKDLNAMGLFSEQREEWKRSSTLGRQLVAPAFASSRVAEMKPNIVKHALELKVTMDQISKDQKAVLDHSCYDPTKLNDDIIGSIRMKMLQIMIEVGFSWGLGENLISPGLLDDIGCLMRVIGKRVFAALPIWKIFWSAEDRRADRAVRDLYAVVDRVMGLMDQSEAELTEAYLKKDGGGIPSVTKRTLLHSFILARKSSIIDSKVPYMPDDQIKGNLLHMIAASYDTTPTTIMWTLDMLCKYPDVQEKVLAEIDSVLGHIEDWTSLNTIAFLETLEVKDFPYLEMVLQETMRFRPVGPTFFATNYERVNLCGHEIPAKSNIALMTRVASLKQYGRACGDGSDVNDDSGMTFNPSNWDGEHNPEMRRKMLSESLSFGAGPRICPGRHLAMLDMILILSISILSDKKVRYFPKPPGHDVVVESTQFVLTPENLHPLLQER